MICKIIGAVRKSGTFEGREYDNVNIRVMIPSAGEAVEKGLEFGYRVAEFKVKSSILPIDRAFEYYQKGVDLEIYFDQYKSPVLFNPVKS